MSVNKTGVTSELPVKTHDKQIGRDTTQVPVPMPITRKCRSRSSPNEDREIRSRCLDGIGGCTGDGTQSKSLLEHQDKSYVHGAFCRKKKCFNNVQLLVTCSLWDLISGNSAEGAFASSQEPVSRSRPNVSSRPVIEQTR
ncbi:hypothetical protein EYZ11_003834 [Aspergillus tanneri]|uniref:Uncharacterized protein n=1 Tax=Aspergillus tanneri TaxID=1220188 RepID=A0A4S3JM23_9EURO|nr:hypothetical protein EYZ11_003834 [Aspergillus tanneri]